MKKRLLLALSLLLVTLLVSVAVLVVRTMRRSADDLVRLTLDIAPGVAQQIRDFKRVKTRGGRVEWEVAAREAQVFEDSKAVEVTGVSLHWYMADGRVIGLTSDRGTITLDGREIERIQLDGGVVVSLADYEVRMMSASYEQADDVILAPGDVDISGKALRLRGTGMRVDVRNEQLALLHQVSMDLDPTKVSKGGDNAPL